MSVTKTPATYTIVVNTEQYVEIQRAISFILSEWPLASAPSTRGLQAELRAAR